MWAVVRCSIRKFQHNGVFWHSFRSLIRRLIGCPTFRSDLWASLYSASFKVSVLDGVWAGVGGVIGASGGSSGGAGAHGFGAGGGVDGAGADGGAEDRCAGYWPSGFSISLNFRPESSSELPSCCLVKLAMVMGTISLCSGSSVTVTDRNRCSLSVCYGGLQGSHVERGR